MTASVRRTIVSSLIVFVVGAAVVVGMILIAAQLDSGQARQRVIAAFDSGALTVESERPLEVVTGFVVAQSDTYSTCMPLSMALSAPADVFGLGPWTAEKDCNGLRAALEGGPGELSWFRYWNGNGAVLKVLLTVMSYQAVQAVVSVGIAVLVLLLGWRAWRFSRTFGVGVVALLGLTSDLLWQGMSPGVGISSAVGLLGVLAVQVGFERGWAGRWGLVPLAGLAYAATAQMHVPIAFAILSGLMVMVPMLAPGARFDRWRAALGLVAAVVWVAGYAAGLFTRYAWIALRSGWSAVTGEVGTNSPNFMSDSIITPFHGLVSLLMRTWFDYGWMQVGLMIAFGVIGWSLAKGGARGLLSRPTLVSLAPSALGVLWLLVWGRHTQHLFVNVLLSVMLLNVLFSVEFARRVSLDESRIPTDSDLVREQLGQHDQRVEPVAHAAPPVDR